MVISLVPKDVAEEGYQFTHLGGTETCKECKLLPVCVNSLEIGSTYEVTQVREKEHNCLIDNSKMVVCELKELNDQISVKYQKYLENIVLTREPIDCLEVLCEYHENCVSDKYHETTKIKVLRNLGKIKCPLKHQLVLIEGKKMPK